jgi:putative flavoprotein involved in K+ transport
MRQISTVIIGAGQAGLAMSKCLSERSVPHVVIERGEVANSWATERWNSLKLLTPNWQSRLPGYHYGGTDPDGYMSMPEVGAHLQGYARSFDAPVECRTTVDAVTVAGFGYRVSTDRGDWVCDNLVLATGACAQAQVPQLAQGVPDHITQLTPQSYKAPDQIGPRGVLVVGGSASGTQIAAELLEAGCAVTLSVGAHIRMPRQHRGRDVQWWMDRSGVLDTHISEVDDRVRARNVPSLQLVGDADLPFLDFNYLQDLGAEITGRWVGLQDGTAQFSGSLANQCALSDLKMRRLLGSFDNWAETQGLTDLPLPPKHGQTTVPEAPRLTLDLKRGAIKTIIWATGHRPDFSFAKLPIFDRKGAIRHESGVVGPGLYVLGLPFQMHRKSALIDGVGQDAMYLADHLHKHHRNKAA